MTSLKNSKPESCPRCGGPIAERPAHPYPVRLQVLFGASFFAFFFGFDWVKPYPWVVWSWSGIQIALGIALIRGRVRARRRVFRCVRCAAQVA